MIWILLILLVIALVLNFGKTAGRTDKPAGIILTLLLAAAAGLYCAKSGIDITANIIAHTADATMNTTMGDGERSSELAEAFKLPSLGGSIFRAIIGIPLTLCAIVLIIKNRFAAGEQTIPEAVGLRFRLSLASTILMLGTFIAASAVTLPHTKAIFDVGVLFTVFVLFFLLFALVCPILLLWVIMLAGVGVITFLQLLTLPIMLFFASSAFYLVSAACGVSFVVKGIKLSGLKKRYMVPFILLGLIPGANNVIYFALPKFVAKHN